MNRTPPGEKAWCPEAKSLWRRLHSEFTFTGSETATLKVALNALTRLRQAEDQLDGQPLVYESKTGLRRHPLCEVIRAERSGYLNAMSCLKLGKAEEEPMIGRPPGSRKEREWHKEKIKLFREQS
jgi:hypothetical protein